MSRMNKREPEIRELLLDGLHKIAANVVLQIILLVLIPLLRAGITTNRRDVDHAVAELDESSSFDGNIQIRNVVQDEAYKLLVVVLTNPLNEAGTCKWLTHTVCSQAVLRKAKVEEGSDRDRGGAELLLLFDQIGASHEANGDLVAEC